MRFEASALVIGNYTARRISPRKRGKSREGFEVVLRSGHGVVPETQSSGSFSVLEFGPGSILGLASLNAAS
jgi:hypothetical protein